MPSRLNRQAVAGVLVVAALAVGQVLNETLPETDSMNGPFYREGTVGETVHLRYGDVRIGKVRGSTSIGTAGMALKSPEMFLVIPVTFTAADRPTPLSYAAVRAADGTLYEISNGQRDPFMLTDGQPGIPLRADAAVEIRVDDVAGAHLLLATDPSDHRRDDMADIDLGLTEADAEEWAAEKDLIGVQEATEVPPKGGTS